MPVAAGPLITVVIPTWNRAALVQQAIASVAAQTYPHWELIVVDDGSNDGTAGLLEVAGDKRVRVLALEHCGNPARLRNEGIRAGSGEFAAFLDSDDLWLPRKLELQVGALRSRPSRWCYGGFDHIDSAGDPIPARAGAFRPVNGHILKALLREQTSAYVGTLLVERSLLDEVGGFDETMRLRADLDLELRLAARAEAVAVAETIMRVRVHPGRLTSGVADPHEATARVFRQCLARETDREVRALARARYARVLSDGVRWRLRRGEWLPALRLLAKAIATRWAPR